jgi:hypothetical protein
MNLPAASSGEYDPEIPPNSRGDQFGFEFSIHFVLENLVSLIQTEDPFSKCQHEGYPLLMLDEHGTWNLQFCVYNSVCTM